MTQWAIGPVVGCPDPPLAIIFLCNSLCSDAYIGCAVLLAGCISDLWQSHTSLELIR
jgi:hypothetical protein